ncbi:apolipoprotein N-acyltransferase [Persicobacter psychrovividus]|uniref:Apolipoprotein N-acyltransferase n=1 Tax=Persicobacter psychrovividus TaxID=387638 RepID=A0ABM7VA12_9BACT|nr:apolipoprotein N-acyltransferase [Persicobacter psychrovividus]
MNNQLRYKKIFPLLLSGVSGLFFWLAWPDMPLTFLLFFIFVPVFAIRQNLIDRKVEKVGRKFFGWAYLTVLLWNITTTWWVGYATAVGAGAMLLTNSLLMTLPLMGYHFVRKRMPAFFSYLSFVIFWLTFENIHLNWGLSWPWLNLGNGFADYYKWIQWYSVTGVGGGTLWILLLNIAFYQILFQFDAIYKGIFRWLSLSYLTLFGIGLPVGISYWMYNTYTEQGEEVEFVVMQPNIDPYTEKFANTEHFIPFAEQLNRFITLSEEKITDSTAFLLWPESALDKLFLQKDFNNYSEGRRIFQFKKSHPDLNLLTGLTTYVRYEQAKEKPTVTARFRKDVGYYDVYNAGLFVSDQMKESFYHKSKLVPGVEATPYPWLFDFLTQTVFNMGGTTGNYGVQKERTVFYSKDSIGIAPSICYESIYGDFMASYVRNGANFITIITNDGWWKDTPGHRQHLDYARLRAIENRRSVARSANTGTSAFINQRGDVSQPTKYWTQAVIKEKLHANKALTFYTKNGDYIGRTAQWLAIFFLLSAFVKGKTKGLIDEEL